MSTKKEKKRKKDKTVESKVRKRKSGTGGRQKLINLDLDVTMKLFAEMVGRNIDPVIAGDSCHYSKYQVRKYLQLPKVQEEIEKWAKVYSKTSGEAISLMRDELTVDMFAEMRKMIHGNSETQLSESGFFKLWEMLQGSANMISVPNEDPNSSSSLNSLASRSQKNIKRPGLPSSQKKLTFDEDNDDSDNNDDDDDDGEDSAIDVEFADVDDNNDNNDDEDNDDDEDNNDD